MSKVCTWIRKVSSYDTELSVYRLLHPLEADISPVKFWRRSSSNYPETTPLDPITDVVQGLIHGIRMEKLKLGLLHNVIRTRNVMVILREGNRSPVIGLANSRNPGYGDEEWERGHPLRFLVDPEDGCWERIMTPYEMSDWHYKELLADDEPYLPRTTLHLQFQAQGFNTFEPLAVTAVKRFEPFTSAAVLLVQRLSDDEKAILKLADRRLGYRSGKGRPVPWSSSLED
ncbi:hypothetical protein EDD85DRAFT_958704 [Armillaria nabsnona]|nr:hypothetical protein EDD85DRAFT_958704 [Armillaria nabsnona]